MRRSTYRFAALAEDAEACERALPTIHPEGLPWLLHRIIDLWLRAAEYGHPDQRAEARTRASLAAGQLALVLGRAEPRPLSRN